MGVSRGLKNKLNYTVVNQKGEILSSGTIEGADRQTSAAIGKQAGYGQQGMKSISPSDLHVAANRITNIAAANEAQVIVQNLREKGDGIT